jgi:membrane-associated phospholipid phosphatase
MSATADVRREDDILSDDTLWNEKWRLTGRLALALGAVVAGLWAVGWPLVNLEAFGWIRDLDVAVSADLEAGRTPLGDQLSAYGSSMSDTLACIGVLIIVATTLRLWLGRWHEAVILFVAIGGELLLFLAVTGVIARERPAVQLLDPAPPTSSYPSGHTAAAVALYGCIAILLVRLLRPVWLAAALVSLLWLIPVAVGVSRMYRGMHYLSDVVMGAIGGGVWLILVLLILLPRGTQPAVSVRSEERQEAHAEGGKT